MPSPLGRNSNCRACCLTFWTFFSVRRFFFTLPASLLRGHPGAFASFFPTVPAPPRLEDSVGAVVSPALPGRLALWVCSPDREGTYSPTAQRALLSLQLVLFQ